MSKPRIKDIAAEAGVSPATVSRVLNNRPGTMTDETRRRVLEVIERTGYRPSSAARSLRAGRSGVLGVIIADIRNPFSSAMLEELSAQAGARGMSLMTAISGNEPAREVAAIERLVDAGVDGLVVNTCGGGADALAAARGRVPVALLDRDVPGSGLPLVTSNNAALVAGLVDELERAGCDACYLLDEEDPSSLIRRERGRAFTGELARRGLSGSVAALPADAAEAARTVRELGDADGADGPGARTGLVAVNGLVFLRLVEALSDLGAQLPAGLRIATFDEYAWNRVLFGGITTAVQDTHAIAAALLDQLGVGAGVDAAGDAASMSSAPADPAAPRPTRIEVPGHIIHRASTAA